MKRGYQTLLAFGKAAACAVFFSFMCISAAFAAPDPLVQQRIPENTWKGSPAKYVFVFIGDGMGLQQVSSAEAFLAAQHGSKEPGVVMLNFSNFPDQGLSTTYSADSFITDSAPAGTSLATGYKTNNGVIGVDPTKTRSFTTMAELAKAGGMRVGIVSSVSLNHATPASFYAHMPSRNSYYEIGQQLINSGFDYFAGGGLHKSADKDAQGNPRRSLYEVAAEKGWSVLRDRDAILAAQPGTPVLAVNPVLDVDGAMPYAMDQTGKELSLAEFTAKGIELLDNERGFFMMVEGGKVDWACHANDAAASIHDTIAFEKAVQVAVDFAAKHSGDTLILVTGDHETGGMSLGFAGTEYNSFFDKLAFQKLSFLAFDAMIADLRADKGETSTLADVRSMISKEFGLTFPSADEYKALAEHAKNDKDAKTRLGMALSPAEQDQLTNALSLSMSGAKSFDVNSQEFLLYGGYEPLSIQVTHILNNKAGIGWTTYAHTGIPVPVFAKGVGAELFRGYYDNTDIAWKIFSIMGMKAPVPAAFQASL
jgi:alkaline phosphatase